jgi:adenylate kinase family enzyme
LQKPTCIIFAGPQGSGKGTQCQKLISEYGCEYFEMGAKLREASKTNELIKSYMDEGKHVPSMHTDGLVKEFLVSNPNSNILIDGYPRNHEQVIFFKESVQNSNYQIAIVYLKAEYDVLTKRMLERGRADDTLEVIQNRLNQFTELTIPALFTLQKILGCPLTPIDADRTVEEVFEEIKSSFKLFV